MTSMIRPMSKEKEKSNEFFNKLFEDRKKEREIKGLKSWHINFDYASLYPYQRKILINSIRKSKIEKIFNFWELYTYLT